MICMLSAAGELLKVCLGEDIQLKKSILAARICVPELKKDLKAPDVAFWFKSC